MGPLNTIDEILDDLRQGRMVVIMDDEDRENEGDLVMAASKVRPEDVNFMARYIARKGSVTVDGVSLTVNGVSGTRFDVNLVPHTLEVTILGGYRPGTRVNLEVDIIARYLERLVAEGR